METHYKGFTARIFYSADVDIFYGEIINCSELLSFQASSIEDCIEAMHFLIDSYLTNIQKLAEWV